MTSVAERRVCKTINMIFKPLALVKTLKWTVNGELVRSIKLSDAELICARLAITTSLYESEGKINEALWSLRDGFLPWTTSYLMCTFAGDLSDQPCVVFIL